MAKIKKAFVSWEELERYSLSGIGGSFYTKTEVNAMWEGYSGTKGQVHWNRVTNKPSSFTPSAHASAHQAGGGDPLSNLLLGASPSIKWQSGSLLLKTDEGTNTTTYLFVEGKGTGYGEIDVKDGGNAEYLRLACINGIGYIRMGGGSPSALYLQSNIAQDVKIWSDITSGNPYFYRYGYKTGVGVKYGRDWVDTSGIYNIQGQDGLRLRWPSYYADNSFLVANNKVYDSARWNGHQMPSLSNEKVLYNNGSALSWERLNLGWLSDVNPNFITPYEACLLAYHGGNWVSAMPEYDIRFKSYQIEWEFWGASPPSPWASGALNGGTVTVGSGDDHPGFCVVKTRPDGDATNSGYYWVAANDRISIGGFEQMDFVFKTPSSLTGVRWRLGFQDSITVAAPVDGIYLEMSADTIIRGACRSNSAQTNTGTTYTLAVATWYRGRIIVGSPPTGVEFRIYSEAGTLLWNSNVLNNIPTGINRAVGFGVVAWLNFDDNLEPVIILDLADLICARGLMR